MSWEIRLIHVVLGILKRDDKILVSERPLGKPYSGYWELPGGKIEPNEPSFAALQRELHEELGIEVLAAQSWFEHTHTYPDKTVWLEIWRVDAFVGEPQSRENQALRWVTLLQMLQLRLLEGNVPIVKRLSELWEESTVSRV